MWRPAILAFVAAAALAPTAGARPRPLLFVLAGQSNMVGYGQPVPRETPNAHVLRVALDGTLVPAADPLGDRGDPAAPGSGFGPGMPFAWALEHRDHATTIVLLMCAAGGSSIAEWQPGQPLFETCVRRTRAAAAHARLGGILFLQGEAEAMTASPVDWRSGFTRFATAFRSRLAGPRLPLVFGQIATFADPRFVNQAQIRAQQGSVRLPCASMVATSDLALGGDGIHFTIPSYQELGRRFSAAWEKLARGRPGSRLRPMGCSS